MNAVIHSKSGERGTASVQRGDALPWTLIGAALSAMAALYFSSDRFVGLPVLAVLLVLSRFTTWRLPRSFIIAYGSRAVILVVLLTLINQTDPYDATIWYLKQADTNLAGYAVAADLVLRAWSRRDAAAAREGLGVVVLMTALLFAAATNTYERWHIQIIAPIYVICLLLAFRSFPLMQQPAAAKRTMRMGLVLLRCAAILLTLGIAFTAVYLVSRYEYQVTSWAMRFVRQRHGEAQQIGFAASPQLATIFDPEQPTTRAFLINGTIGDPHMRIATFNTYRRGDWLPPLDSRGYAPFVPVEPPVSINTHLLKFTRLSDTADLLAAPLTTAAITCDDPLERGQSGMLRDTRPGSGQLYTVLDATAPAFQGPLSVQPDENLRKELLVVPPEVDPGVSELARRVAGNGEPARQVFRIQEYLRSHNGYSLRFEPHGDPLSDFILNRRAAHCQYFASAVAIMARAIGVPSRYVGGYYAHEHSGDDQTVIRQRDAHAWAECWIEGTGWVTVDATPSSGRPDGIFTDPPAWKRWWEKLTDLPGEIRDWFTNHTMLLKELAGAGAAVGMGVWIVRVILHRARRPMVVERRYAQPNEELKQMALRFERWMNRRGIACPRELTWRAHLKAQESMPSASCFEFVRAYDRARFGERGADVTEAQTMLDQMERLG